MYSSDVLDEIGHTLQSFDLHVQRNVAMQWMSNRTPVDIGRAIAPQIKYRLAALHARLGGDWSSLKDKRATPLRFDFRVEESTLIEVDWLYHFSTARQTSFEFYDGIDHDVDIDRYRMLCKEFSDDADKYQGNRSTTDFPIPGGRTARRAYFDTAKDFLAAAKGYRLIRLPAASIGFDQRTATEIARMENQMGWRIAGELVERAALTLNGLL